MIVGHKKQWDFLNRKFDLKQLSHAYIFVGPEEIGKRSFAKEFIKKINCKESCVNDKIKEQCQSCKMVDQDNNPDTLIVRQEGNSEIQIAQLRAVQHFLSLKPYYGDFKAVIIDNADRMNQEAQSCFLKTLEEPKGNTMLILISARPEMLMSTILSRCQLIKFLPVNKEEIEKHLLGLPAQAGNSLTAKTAKDLAVLSEGKIGRAIKFSLSEEKIKEERELLVDILKICDQDLALKFKYAKDLPDGKLSDILAGLKRYLRYVLLSRLGLEEFVAKNYMDEVVGRFMVMPISRIKEIIRLIEKIDFQLATTNANPKLALEILLLEV